MADRAIDLVGTEHARGCRYGQLDAWVPGRSTHPARCTCGLAERQEAARAIDARVAALEGALREAREDVEAIVELHGGGTNAPYRLARIDALLAGVPR